jgi:hypothetical protein
VAGGNFNLIAQSAGKGAGTVGQDLGAMVPDAISITAEPATITTETGAVLTVGGPGMFAFKYTVDGGAEVGPLPIGNGFDPSNAPQRTAIIQLADLAPGTHRVAVVGQDFAGNWQVEPTLSKTWTVDPNHSQLVISEISAEGDWIELHNAGAAALDLSGMGLSDSAGDAGEFTLPAGTLIAGRSYLVITPDNFGLDQDGDSVVLFDSVGASLDRINFGFQIPGKTLGSIEGEWCLTVPTPAEMNIRQPMGDPLDSDSLLRLRFFEESETGSVQIKWDSVFGAHYRVMVSTDLQSWQELPESRSVGRSSQSHYTYLAVPGTQPRYYRVEASPYF